MQQNKLTFPYLYDLILPNFILPNATPIDSAIVALIRSMNSSLDQDNYIFQLANEDQSKNPMKLLFGNTRHEWPNSLDSRGSNFNSSCYKFYADVKIDSVYLGRRHNNKYVYPITVSPCFHNLFGYGGEKLAGDYFWKHMSSIVLDDVRNGRAVIHLDYTLENWVTRHDFTMLHSCLEKGRIPFSQVALTFNSFNAKEVYENWFKSHHQKINVFSLPFLMYMISDYYRNNSRAGITYDQFINTKDKIRNNYYTFKSRRPRHHRIALLYKLVENNLLDKGNWSFLTKLDPLAARHNQLLNNNVDESLITKLVDMTPQLMQGEQGGYHHVNATDNNSSYTLDAYFDICTETTISADDYLSLTEKVFKPLINFQPFIFYSFPKSLDLLRRLGFKTFHPFINEDYDNEMNENTRFQMILNEINRLTTMSKEEIHNWFWSMEDILVHNHNHMLNICNNSSYIEEWVLFLKNKLSM